MCWVTQGWFVIVILLAIVQVCNAFTFPDSSFGGDCGHWSECVNNVQCVDPFRACYDDNYTNPKWTFEICFNITSNLRNVSSPACVGVPDPVLSVEVSQVRNEDNESVTFNVTWVESPRYVGPVRYLILMLGDFLKPLDPIFNLIDLSDEGINSKLIENLTGGWTYNFYITAITAAGHSLQYGPVRVTAEDTIPKTVEVLSVRQDFHIAEQMYLTFRCPDIPSGVIKSFIIRKTVTIDGTNVSSEHVVPMTGSCSFMKSVEGSDVGGIRVNEQYYFQVKIENAYFIGEYSEAVGLFVEERRPVLTISTGVDKLLGPPIILTSFTLKMCSSCLVNPTQGVVRAAAVIVCDRKNQAACQSSYVNPGGRSSAITIEQPEDLSLFHNWASARAHNFSIPYCTTPFHWHQELERDNSTDYHYIVGGSYCDASDNQTQCNGPLPGGRDFIVTVIVCNDAGCDEEHYVNEKFTTKPGPDAQYYANRTVVGLAAALGIALFNCFLLVFHIMRGQSPDSNA